MKQIPLDPRPDRASRFGPLLPTATLAGFWIAIAAVAVVALLSYSALQGSVDNARRVTHTLQVVEQLQALLSTMKDAETGQRGFLLTGDENYLEPYNNARSALAGELAAARALIVGSPEQQQRLQSLEQFCADKMAELASTIVQRRKGDSAAALATVRTDRGKEFMERIRAITAEMTAEERRTLAARQAEWLNSARISSIVTVGGSALLLAFIIAAALRTSRDYRARQIQAWIRAGQMGLSERIQGEQRLEKLSDNVLEFLAGYLQAQTGAIYLATPEGAFRRFAGYAAAGGPQLELVRPGDGLIGQAAKENRTLHVTEVPEGYLSIGSSLGRSKPTELLVAPASVDGVVYAVFELGFFRRLAAADHELLERVSESLGVAVRSSKDRTRLEELLEETQRQGEALRTQQEELRVSNEELEVQAQSLRESQLHMQNQQVELEQTNSQLEEQAQILEQQRDELSRAQSILVEKATQLEQANEYKSEFLANMSHELRTPLNSALILAKILSDNKPGNLSDEQVRFARTISSAGNDLLAIINDVLDLSKVEAGKVELIAEAVILEAAVEQWARAFQPVAQQKGLAFRIVLEPESPPSILTDPQRLGQIVKNLLSNAVKFTDKGEISLRVYASDADTVSFAVQDSGIGISEHQQGIIFEAFRQADGSTHRKYGGTGLGLTISRDLARLLGGDIAVRSRVGEGSVFTLTLPREFGGVATRRAPDAPEPRTAAAVAPARAHDAAALPKPTAIEDDRTRLAADARLVLVVEDDVAFASILRDLAREMGFQCVVTHSAADGAAAALLYRPKAILLDVNLPDHSGLGVLDQLKRNPHTRHIPVHIVSVADYTHEALSMGAVGYALKPVKREQLVQALERLEAKFSQDLRNVLIVEDDERQRESLTHLLANGEVRIAAVANAAEALARLKTTTFDCMVLDLNLPDLSGYDLLQQMTEQDDVAFPPVIVYTGRALARDEEHALRRFSKSIIIKDVRSPERLLDEVTLFLHQVESKLPADRQRMLQQARDRDATLEGRRILIVEDDVRNIFALTSLLEPKGARIQIARNGREAIEALTGSMNDPARAIDLVLMDIMMPEMDGITAMREIRTHAEWKKLPIIALTAKAMRDDQEKCLAAGANDYIAKPLDVEKLLSLVRVWMPK
jgi:signal transduction histidine kinase/DNA-binding response OmpR family regulator/CHASE3 domain sensor protein